ncbi:ABC transporter permease subunit [Kribbella sp. NPDC050281]|uniref:ABC transporter permease n=1 Tax=Kribbella sp. NPDC050281 TaxID=3155515 RepID=UPI0033E1E32C
MTTVLSSRRDQKADSAAAPPRPRRRVRVLRELKRCWQLYVMLAVPMLLLAIYNYWPMYGVQIAFRDYNVVDGITGSPWAGLKYFQRFVESYQFWPVVKNTIVLNIYELVATFPLPIVLAIGLNYVRRRWFGRTVQMVTYAPHFISTVIVVGMVFVLADPNTGLLNALLHLVGLGPIDVTSPGWFRHVYVWSGAWQSVGFSAVVYLAALSGIDPQLYEAAVIDGASKLRRIWHIDLPGIAPVAVILFVLTMGSMFTLGFEKVLLLQNPLNFGVSEVIDTYVYKVGLASDIPQYSYATAIGLFKSILALVLMLSANKIARKTSGWSLW